MKANALFSLIAAGSIALSSVAFAGAKTYQVTGPVVDVNDKMITVMKGKEKWEIDRASDTKVTGDVKVGEKVTITYTMAAKEVEMKAAKTAKQPELKAAASPAASAAPSPKK